MKLKNVQLGANEMMLSSGTNERMLSSLRGLFCKELLMTCYHFGFDPIFRNCALLCLLVVCSNVYLVLGTQQPSHRLKLNEIWSTEATLGMRGGH